MLVSSISKSLLVQSSSADAKRVFSLLKPSFNDQQDNSLKDYIESSLMPTEQYQSHCVLFYCYSSVCPKSKIMPVDAHNASRVPRCLCRLAILYFAAPTICCLDYQNTIVSRSLYLVEEQRQGKAPLCLSHWPTPSDSVSHENTAVYLKLPHENTTGTFGK